MTEPTDEHAQQNERRREKAAELIAKELRKRQRARIDEALLEADRLIAAVERTRKHPEK